MRDRADEPPRDAETAGPDPEERTNRRRAPRSAIVRRAREEADFNRRLVALTPRAWVTPTIVAINALVFVAMVATGVSPMEPDIESMIAWGADFGPRTAFGQPWRLLTSTFLHFGLIHIGLNMWVLWDAGRITERLFGNHTYLALYLLAGLGGSATSLAWHPDVVSAGASGAVFGVYGGLLAFVKRGGGHLPAATLKRLKKSGIGFVLYNVGYGFLADGINNAAHLGGLATGFLVGCLLVRPLDLPEATAELDGPPRMRRAAQAAIVVLLCCAGAIAAGQRVGSAAGFDAWDAGMAALEDGDNAEALARFEEAIQELPDQPVLIFNRSLAHEGLGNMDAAMADATLYAETVPDDPDGDHRLEYLQELLDDEE